MPEIHACLEAERHFADAVAAYAKKDYKVVAADIRKADQLPAP